MSGLLLEGQPKSISPLVDRLPGAEVQALRQFVNQSPWARAPLQAALTPTLLDRLLPEAVLITHYIRFPKKGMHSVGVARQSCGALGKTANCQVAVRVHFGIDTTSLPLTWRLYLPHEWIDEADRRAQARVPADVACETKNALALEALDAVLAWGVGHRVVLADAGTGPATTFGRRWPRMACRIAYRRRPAGRAGPPRYRPRRPTARVDIPRDDQRPTRSRQVARPMGSPPPSRRAWRTLTRRQGTMGSLRSRSARSVFWPSHGVGWSYQTFVESQQTRSRTLSASGTLVGVFKPLRAD
ncbi:MAG: transposase, partial [Gemmatimonadaceae bacterium]|nr:transposase [Gemmatimonadaceae bacterium]